jgi:NAD(P)H-nitrite reductase large subunit
VLKHQGKFDIHVISSLENPLEHIFGKEIGEMLTYKHKTHGIKCHMKNGVKEILKNQYGNVCGLILNDGTKIDGINMVIIGGGINPNTGFLSR